MTTGPVRRLALKELREALRDRRTVVTLVLMPLLVYPLLGVLFRNVLIATNPAEAGPVPTVFESRAGAAAFGTDAGAEVVAGAEGAELFKLSEELTLNPLLFDREGDTLERAVAEGRAELGVRVGPDAAAAERSYTLLTRSGSPLSVETGRRIAEALDARNLAALRERLRDAGEPDAPPLAVAVERIEPLAGNAVSLATVVPLILLLMTATGAVYPAIDTTAGERERGTLETLVAAPVSRVNLLLGKFVAVWAVAVLTAAANLFAMTVTVYAVGLDGVLFAGGVPWWSVPATLGLLTLTAAFFAAVLLAVTSAARSFKEAQAYLIPLMLCCLAPGGLALTPSVSLTVGWAAVPLVNLVLLSREALGGTADPLAAAVAVLSTLCYAGLGLSVAARIFGTDAILYGGPGGWKEFLKPAAAPGGTPPLAAVILGTLGFVAAYLVLGSLPGKLAGVTADRGLEGANLTLLMLLNAAVAAAVFAVLPLLVTRWAGGNLRTTFALPPPSRRLVVAALGALLMGLGLWAGVFELLKGLGAEDRIAGNAKFADLADRLSAAPLPLVLLCFAVVPAACEEVAFRGFVLTGLQPRIGATRAVLVSGVTFGLFHVLRDLGLWDRLLASTLMGLALGWVRVRSDALWPGMILHAVHNGLLLSVGSYADRLEGLIDPDAAHLPPWLLATCAACVTVGAGLVWRSGRDDV